jgi:HAD superfamily hydrolase (TIGR01484 family)
VCQKEKEKILSALRAIVNSPTYDKPAVVYGDVIEDRGSQITFSALGQKAPADLKYAWDPTRVKRERISAILKAKIPEFDIRVGGASSVDVTRKGVNKAYGIRKLEQYLDLGVDDIVFVGDALFYGGNDYPAKSTGVDCISVKGPDETMALIKSWA